MTFLILPLVFIQWNYDFKSFKHHSFKVLDSNFDLILTLTFWNSNFCYYQVFFVIIDDTYLVWQSAYTENVHCFWIYKNFYLSSCNLKKKIILSLCPFSEIMTFKKNFKHSFKVLDTNSDLILATFALTQVSFVIINSLTVWQFT